MPNIKSSAMSELRFEPKSSESLHAMHVAALISRRNQFVHIDIPFDSVKIPEIMVQNPT